jgi:hypothetical protein
MNRSLERSGNDHRVSLRFIRATGLDHFSAIAIGALNVAIATPRC